MKNQKKELRTSQIETTQRIVIYPIPLMMQELPSSVVISRFLSQATCRRVIRLATKKGFQRIHQSRYGQETFQAEFCPIHPIEADDVYKKFAIQAAVTNHQYWRLSLVGIAEPFTVIRYFPGDWIRPHTDTDYRIPDPSRLSCIIQLVSRSSFAGGTLTIAENDGPALDEGDAVFFPSHTIHTVSRVERGCRITLACWAHGPLIT